VYSRNEEYTMSRLLGRGLVLLAASTLLPGILHAKEEPKANGTVSGEPIVYKTIDGTELRLYVLKPADWKKSDTRPAIVFCHGGGWTGGTPSQFEEQAKYLAGRGMVCVHVQYRLLKGDAKALPIVCIQDAKSAMRWVRSHAAELGIDPNRIAAADGSAGGHLAAFVGIMDTFDDPKDDLTVWPRANALVLFNPVFERPGTEAQGFADAEHGLFASVHPVTRPLAVELTVGGHHRRAGRHRERERVLELQRIPGRVVLSFALIPAVVLPVLVAIVRHQPLDNPFVVRLSASHRQGQ